MTTLKTAPIGAIDSDTDHKVVYLSKERIEQGMTFGYMRAEENRNSADKQGYDKNDPTKAHSNPDNDALGTTFEIAVCEAMGLDASDPAVITLFRKKPYPPDSPDIFGIYECRRLNSWQGGITYYDKDVINSAYVIAGIVDHDCDPVNKRIRITGRVTLLGWNYPLIDYVHNKRTYADGGTIKNLRMRPLSELPMLNGAGWAA